MQKTFKNQQGREFLFISDTEIINPSIKKTREGKPNQLHYFVPYTYDTVSNQRLEILPQGNYQILCLAKDAKEEQAASMVDKIGGRFKIYYKGNQSTGSIFSNISETAKDSLTSLITSLGFKEDDNVLILEKL